MTIGETFHDLDRRGEGALIAYVTGGDPSPKYTPLIVEALSRGGADIVEIGVPFSDPVADGPTIQAADNRALEAGTTPRLILDIVARAKRRVETPIALLTYYNILFRKGVCEFIAEASDHGVDGFIMPDLPIEEAEEYRRVSLRNGVDTIFLATPSTPIPRLKRILSFTTGFLYLVSLFGVTGARKSLAQITTQTVEKFHHHTAGAAPMAVGFGISKPSHVRAIIKHGAEGAIIGSAFVKVVEKNLNKPSEISPQIQAFAEKLKAATLRY